MKNLVGRTINKRYRVDESLGRGGMAEVYKVFDTHSSVFLAMKVLNSDLAEDTSFVRRLKREAKNLAKLQHSNIVRTFGVEKSESTIFQLMEFIESSNLAVELFYADRPFSLSIILEIMKPVCHALDYAHQVGIVHGDIKPLNILIEESGRVLLTDFGIATVGTPGYRAPEQIYGGKQSAQTDVYSLGCLLYDMLTCEKRPIFIELGTQPANQPMMSFEESRILNPLPTRWLEQSIKGELEEIIKKCMRQDPEQRYSNVLDLLNDLEKILHNTEAINDSNHGQFDHKKEPYSGIMPGFSRAVDNYVPVDPEAFSLDSDDNHSYIPLNDKHNYPAWSPDGQKIAFSSKNINKKFDIQITTVGGNQSFKLTNTGWNDINPAWTPDGNYLLFISDRDGTPNIYKSDVNDKGVWRISTKDILLDSFVLSPDGCHIVFTKTSNKGTEIYNMNLDGSQVSLLFDGIIENDIPSWAPDSRIIFFVTNQNGEKKICSLDIMNGQCKFIHIPGLIHSPKISPDGEKIVFYESKEDHWDIKYNDLANNTVNYLLSQNCDFLPFNFCWSPDNKRIVFSSGDDHSSPIGIIYVNSKSIRYLNLPHENIPWGSPIWSPDGCKIAFLIYRNGNLELFVMSAD